MNKNTICLWYNYNAEEAANFYAQTFPESKIGAIIRSPLDNPSNKEGDIMADHAARTDGRNEKKR